MVVCRVIDNYRTPITVFTHLHISMHDFTPKISFMYMHELMHVKEYAVIRRTLLNRHCILIPIQITIYGQINHLLPKYYDKFHFQA